MARRRDSGDETAPAVDYDRAGRLFAEGRTAEEVAALCPGVDLHHPSIAAHARDAEKAAKVVRTVDAAEIKRRLLEIADDDETEPDLRVKILLGLLDRC